MEVAAVVGLTASVVGLLTAGAQISSVLGEYISAYRSANALAQTVHYELHDFSFVLSKLQPLILGSEPLNQSRASLIDIDHLTITLTGCVCTFSELEKEVVSLASGAGGKLAIMERIKLSRVEKTLGQLIQRLQGHKLSLTLILTILTSESSVEVKNCHDCLTGQLLSSMPVPNSAPHGLLPSAPGPSEGSILGPADDSNSILGDDSDSIITVTTRSYRRPFKPALFLSRPYRTLINSGDSVISLRSSQRRIPRWSPFSGRSDASVFSLTVSTHVVSGISLAEMPDPLSLSLPVAANTLYNSKWYHPNATDVSPVTIALSNATISRALAPAKNRASLNALLPTAAGKGQTGKLRQLLDWGADKDAKTKEGNTPLHIAAHHGHEEVA